MATKAWPLIFETWTWSVPSHLSSAKINSLSCEKCAYEGEKASFIITKCLFLHDAARSCRFKKDTGVFVYCPICTFSMNLHKWRNQNFFGPGTLLNDKCAPFLPLADDVFESWTHLIKTYLAVDFIFHVPVVLLCRVFHFFWHHSNHGLKMFKMLNTG